MKAGRLALCGVLATAGCGGTGESPEATLAGTAARPDVLLVTIDTLRADRVGAYGYAAAQTPTLDALAGAGLLLEQAVVHSPQTLPSHVSILTGLLPHEHGIRDNFAQPLDEDVPTLASLFRAAGYTTAAFIGALPVSSHSGLQRGFDRYDDPFAALGFADTFREAERPAEQVVAAALEWLERAPSPYLAWVHLYDPHEPYTPPSPYAERFASRPYDGEVAYADAQLARLIEALERSGRRARTLLVVTGDHGEGLGDHGEDEHLMFVYDSTIRVPLLMSWPGELPAGQRVAGQFRSVDLVPTLLELAGLPEARTSGVSRAPALRAASRLPDNESYTESLFGQLHYGFAPLRALRAGRWKYIEAPRPELYDLSTDPGETHNLVERQGRLAVDMRERLRRYDRGEDAPEVDLDGPRAGLLALGYLSGGGSVAGAEGADPKDHIAAYQAHIRKTREGLRLAGDGRFAEAAATLRALSGGAYRSFDVEYFLARSLFQIGKHAEALTHYRAAIELQPGFAPAYAELARCYQMLERFDAAEDAIARGLDLDPANAQLLAAKGLLLQQRGDLAGARAAFVAARDREPSNPQIRLALAETLQTSGDTDAAIAELEQAVSTAPRWAQGWNTLGVLHGRAGRQGPALAAFEKAVAAAPDVPVFGFNLALALANTGRHQEATAELERLARRFPDYEDARRALAEIRAAAPRASTAPARPTRLRLLLTPDRASADAARRRLAAGEDFAALARELSRDPSAADGGDLGALSVDDLAEPLRSAARRLRPGEVSEPVPTPRGVALLKREH